MTTVRRVAVAALALALAGCGPTDRPSPTSAESSDAMSPDRGAGTVGLVALVGRVGDMRLEHLGDGVDGTPAVPDPDTRWVSGDRSRGLVLTVGLAGRLLSTGPFAAEAPTEWRRTEIRTMGGALPRHPPAFATLSPDGRRIAAVAADMDGGGSDTQLVVIDRDTGEAVIYDLHASIDGRPPAWLAEDIVAIVVRDATDRTAITRLRLPGGEASTLAVQSGPFTASGDGSIVALQTRGDQQIVVGSRVDLEAGRPLEVVRTDLDGNPLAAQLLLDARGDRLAVAWLDDAGDTRSIAVYVRGPDGWTPLRRWDLPPGANRAVLGGFDP